MNTDTCSIPMSRGKGSRYGVAVDVACAVPGSGDAVRVYRILDEELRKRWCDLWDASSRASVFNSPAFFESCLAVMPVQEYRVVAAYRDGVMVGILPLVRSRLFGVRVWTGIGRDGNYADKSPLLTRSCDRSVLKVLLFGARTLGAVCIPEADEEMRDCLEALSAPAFLSVPVSVSRHAALSRDADVLRYMSSRQRRRIRHHCRGDERCPAPACRIYEGNDLPEAFSIIRDIEARSNKSRLGRSFFTRDEPSALFSSLMRTAAPQIRVSILSYGTLPVAGAVVFVARGVFSVYYMAYDDAYRHRLPGIVHAFLLFETFRKEGYETADFLRGDSDMKRRFAPEIRTQYDACLSSSRLILAWWGFASRRYWAARHAVTALRDARGRFRRPSVAPASLVTEYL